MWRFQPYGRISEASQRNSSVKLAISLRFFTNLCYQKKPEPFKSRRPKAHQLQAGTVYVQEKAICGCSEDYSPIDDSFYLQIQVQCTQASSKKIPTPTHLITNLAYRLRARSYQESIPQSMIRHLCGC